jgi:hypothetical protein
MDFWISEHGCVNEELPGISRDVLLSLDDGLCLAQDEKKRSVIPSWARQRCLVDHVHVWSENFKTEIANHTARLTIPTTKLDKNTVYSVEIQGRQTVEYKGSDLRPYSCWQSYSDCSSCWHDFNARTKRFDFVNERDVEAQMKLAAWFREYDTRYNWGSTQDYINSEHSDAKGIFDERCENSCQLGTCFACVHEPKKTSSGLGLGVLRGKQTLMDTHLIHSSSDTVQLMEPPVDDTLVISDANFHSLFDNGDGIIAGGMSENIGFPGSALHNGTHFMIYLHAGYMKGLVRVSSADGIHWSKDSTERLRPTRRAYSKDKHLVAVLTGKRFKLGNGHDFCVLHDEHETDPAMRYKMAYSGLKPIANSIRLAVSRDGLHWSPTDVLLPGVGDTIPCIFREMGDGGDSEYTAVGRRQWYSPRYYRETRGTVVQQGRLVREDGMPIAWKPSKSGTRYIQFDMDGKDENMRRHMYSFTRTRLYGGEGGEGHVYIGIAQVFEWPRSENVRPHDIV